MTSLTSYFNDIDDPRSGNAPRHKFCNLMTISLLCALCGAETAVDMGNFRHYEGGFFTGNFSNYPMAYLAMMRIHDYSGGS